jgi:hypothetical protein
MCFQDSRLLSEAAERGDKSVYMTGLPEHIKAAESSNDFLHDAPINPLIFDNLEILIFPGLLFSNEHDSLRIATTNNTMRMVVCQG